MGKRRFALRDMRFDETSAVDVGSNPYSRIVFSKSAKGEPMTTSFNDTLAADQQRKIVNDVFSMIATLDSTLDQIVYSSMLSTEQKAEAARASFGQFVAATQPLLDKLPSGSTVGSSEVEKSDVRRKFQAVVEKAGRVIGDGSVPTMTPIVKTRSDVDAEVRKLAESRADARGISVEKAYVEVMKSDGGRLRQQYLDAPSDPIEKSVDVGAGASQSAAFSEIEKLAGDYALKHGVSHAKAVREVSKRRRDLVAKHRQELAVAQNS